jgi:hypothetical protein
MPYCKGCCKDIQSHIWRSHIGAPATRCNYMHHQLPLERANRALADRFIAIDNGDRDSMNVDMPTNDAMEFHTGLGIEHHGLSDSGSSYEDEDEDGFWIDE